MTVLTRCSLLSNYYPDSRTVIRMRNQEVWARLGQCGCEPAKQQGSSKRAQYLHTNKSWRIFGPDAGKSIGKGSCEGYGRISKGRRGRKPICRSDVCAHGRSEE